jgi:hypothetical protein
MRAQPAPRVIVRPSSPPSVVLALLLTALISGCATGARQPSRDLAKAGQALTTAAQGNFSALRDDLDHHVDVLYVESGLSHKPPPSTQQVQAIRGIQESLILRERVFMELGRLYGSLGDFAGYDAAADVERKVNGLTDAVNAFGTTVGSDAPAVSHVTAGFLGRGAGLVASDVQGRMLVAASAAIRQRLEKFADDLRKQQFRFESMRDTLDAAQVRLLALVLGKGVDRGGDALATALSPFNLDLTDAERQKLLTAGGDDLTAALRQVVVHRRQSDFRRQQQVLDTTISGIDQLVQQHAALESGNPLDLRAVGERVAIIHGVVADYQQWRDADRADREARRKAKAAPATQPANG